VICPSCQTDNRSERRFCGACGEKLAPSLCPACAFANFPGESFCGGCGIAVAGALAVAPARAAVAPASAEAERRQMSVMFCDLVGSTKLSAELDPEDLRDLIVGFQGACAAQIARFDGFIARYMGDGMLVYFGYPRAREDNSERAVRAGLAIIDAVAKLSDQPVDVAVRVGIATGRVVVGDIIGDGASEERAVVGETPNLAARLQGLAAPNTLVISDRTRRLVGQLFDVEDLGQHELKGFSDPIQAWRAVGEGSERRFDAHWASAEVPLVGREFELALLQDRWAAVTRGEGRVVSLVGDAGSGKSRLVSAFIDQVNGSRSESEKGAVRYQCVRHQQTTALYPVTDLISRSVQLDLQDSAEERVRKLSQWVARWSSDPARDTASLSTLLGLESATAEQQTPEDRRSEMLAALWRGFLSRMDSEPIVLVFEDVQWADPTTLEFIGGLLERSPGSALMIVVTHRPDFELPWKHGAMTSLPMGKLSPDESEALVAHLAADQELPDAVVSTILERADGVPAFLTELTRAVTGAIAADPDAPLGRVVVPETLHDSLAAQLDRLQGGREIAQMAATIGREFSLNLLSRVYDGSAADLGAGLDELVGSGLVLAPGAGSNGQYAFRHALLCEVAYESLLKSAQRKLHDRIATTLMEQLPEAANADPAGLARHLTEAERSREASAWWKTTAQRAAAGGAFVEAADHLRSSLRCLEAVANRDDVDDAQAVAELRVELASKLRLIGGGAEAFELLDEAEALAARHDLAATLSHVHFTRGNLHFREGDATKCAASHERAIAEARRSGSKLAEVRALGGLADATMMRGQTREAGELANDCVNLAVEHGFLDIASANAPVVGFARFWSNELKEAGAAVDRALALAKQASDVRATGAALNLRVLLDLEAGDPEKALRTLGQLRETAAGHPFAVLFLDLGTASAALLAGDSDESRALVAKLLEGAPPGSYTRVQGLGLALRVCEDAELDSALDELLSVLGGSAWQADLVAVVDIARALVERRQWGRLANIVERLSEPVANADSPRAQLWLDVAHAALAFSTVDDATTRGRLEELAASARAQGLRPAAEAVAGLLSEPAARALG
jgi:class 3 adenylate cyclase/tetratricopeptide (TPR) repeat protein/ABC-type lipoprotein export system ATPase subunit